MRRRDGLVDALTQAWDLLTEIEEQYDQAEESAQESLAPLLEEARNKVRQLQAENTTAARALSPEEQADKEKAEETMIAWYAADGRDYQAERAERLRRERSWIDGAIEEE